MLFDNSTIDHVDSDGQGAIVNDYSTTPTVFTVKNSNFSRVTSLQGPIFNILNDDLSTYLNITDSKFEYNNAIYTGGVIYTINSSINMVNSSFLYNRAVNRDGGALFINAGETRIENCTFHNNTA